MADLLEERGETRCGLAAALGCSEARAAALLRGEVPIDPDLAAHLERALGGSTRFWLAREARYRRSVAPG